MPTDLEFYENSDHLNVKGAKLFTKKLDSILKINLLKSFSFVFNISMQLGG
jgi:hypothetical protein